MSCFSGSALSQQVDSLTLSTLFEKGSFHYDRVNQVEVNDQGGFFILIDQCYILHYSYQGLEDTLFSCDWHEEEVPYVYRFQTRPGNRDILLATNIKSNYRHSFFADYYIFKSGEREVVQLNDQKKWRSAVFSPDGQRIAFTRSNNLFIYDLVNQKTKAVTADGFKNRIINGEPDWSYEEELSMKRGFKWSPDGKYLAFLKFDIELLDSIVLMKYDSLLVNPYVFKYPRSGGLIPFVSLNIYDCADDKLITMEGALDDQYLPRFFWGKHHDVLFFQKMNRQQDSLWLYHWSFKQKNQPALLSYITDSAYIEPFYSDYFFPDENGRFFTLNIDDQGYRHIFLYNEANNQWKQLTSGEWEVFDILGFNEDKQVLFFIANKGDVKEKHLFKLDLLDDEINQITREPGVHDCVLNPDDGFFVDIFSSVYYPDRVLLKNEQGAIIDTLVSNHFFVDSLTKYNMQYPDFFKVSINDDSLNAMVYEPPDFDSGAVHPALFYVYGGPGHQFVLNRWHGKNGWIRFLNQQGFFVYILDNHGTGGRGKHFRMPVYQNLGVQESQEQVELARRIGRLPWIDSARMGIMGWSYGGTVALKSMANDYFRACVAIAPVTDWRLYDAIYTERYMGLPVNNAEGYAKSSVLEQAGMFSGDMMLVHGSFDDNVHPHHSWLLSDRLVKNGFIFNQFFYMNKKHGLGGRSTRYDLFRRVWQHLERSLLKD